MPILKNAKKALRASKRKTEVNSAVKAKMRSSVRKMQSSPAVEMLKDSFSNIDRAVKQNIIHRNKAARMKSSLSKLVTK
ncbi:MAG: 30S ribosomal protein S20 [Microgenomates group bacterium]